MRGAALPGGMVGGGSRGAYTVPPWPLWWRRRKRGPSLGRRPPLLAGVRGIYYPPHLLAGAPLPRVLPVSAVRRVALRGPWVVGPQGGGGASTQRSRRCRAPACRRGAQACEGLGSRAGPLLPRGQHGRCRASGLGDEHLAPWRDPGRAPWAAGARGGAGVAIVARPAAAADAPAEASAPGARRRPMFPADRTLRAAACLMRAAALESPERGALGCRPKATDAPVGASKYTEAEPPPPPAPPLRRWGK